MLTIQSRLPAPKGASSPWVHPAHTQGLAYAHGCSSSSTVHLGAGTAPPSSGLPEMLARRAPSILHPLGLGLSRGLEMAGVLRSFWLLMSPVCVAQSRSSFTFQPQFPPSLQEDTQRVEAVAILLLASHPPEGLPGLPPAHRVL